MGRKQINCKIGDTFGCYKIIDTPYIKGEHLFAKVKCMVCGEESTLCVSELKNRPKQNCKKCRGRNHQKYPDLKIGEKYGIWTIVEEPFKDKGFIWAKCKCEKCGGYVTVRKDRVILASTKPQRCPHCLAKNRQIREAAKTKIRRNSLFETKFNRICHEASYRSIPIYLTPKDLEELYLKQNKRCALTGDYLPDIRCASLDRIDSNGVYSKDNVQWVTKEINLAKHVLSQSDFINMCRKVVNYANQQPSTPLTKCEGSETNSWNSNGEYNGDTSAGHS